MNELEARLAVNVVTEIFKETVKGAHALFKKFYDEARDRDILGLAAQRYADSVERRYNSMKILGMRQAIPLERIYTKVNLLEKIDRFQYNTRR